MFQDELPEPLRGLKVVFTEDNIDAAGTPLQTFGEEGGNLG
jgi:hypothetical protein